MFLFLIFTFYIKASGVFVKKLFLTFAVAISSIAYSNYLNAEEIDNNLVGNRLLDDENRIENVEHIKDDNAKKLIRIC